LSSLRNGVSNVLASVDMQPVYNILLFTATCALHHRLLEMFRMKTSYQSKRAALLVIITSLLHAHIIQLYK